MILLVSAIFWKDKNIEFRYTMSNFDGSDVYILTAMSLKKPVYNYTEDVILLSHCNAKNDIKEAENSLLRLLMRPVCTMMRVT
jgi:hypothetical protein